MTLYTQVFFTTLALAFAMLHAILYYYNRKSKSNLYFALFLLCYAANIFFDFQSAFATSGSEQLVYLRVHRFFLPLNLIFALLFSYTVFDFGIPKYFRFIVFVLICVGVLIVISPTANFDYFTYVQLLIFLEMIRIYRSAIRQNISGAKLIGVGGMLIFLFSMYDVVLDLDIIEPVYGITNGYPVGFAALIVVVSIHLSRSYATMSEKIISQEIKTKELEMSKKLLAIEDERKSKELEDARSLQLSMLPNCLPEINGLRICFDMKTATEVGGDYFDYLAGDDGSMTLTIGDATGHGVRAGIMVSIIKSLFLSQASELDFQSFFDRCTSTIKSMELKNLFMAMLLVRVDNGKLIASSAGMPPILIYRAATKEVEEFVMKGMPLGAFERFQYQKIETNLNPGDTVLLQSDGFAEQFNPDGESLGDVKSAELFRVIADQQPEEIADQLFSEVAAWRGDRQQDDDITFIVFRKKA